jgi:biofilm protein TabA
MILDRLASAKQQYPWLPPQFHAAFDFLNDEKIHQLAGGKHEIDGDRIFAIVQQYDPKPAADCRLEAHRRYWDVQYIAAGEERMGWSPLAGLAVAEAFDADRDVGFYTGNCELFHIPAGTFVIFGPQDAHMPGIAVDDTPPSQVPPGGGEGHHGAPMVRKIVVKVELT